MNDPLKLSDPELSLLLARLRAERDALDVRDAELKAQILPLMDESDRRERQRRSEKSQSRRR